VRGVGVGADDWRVDRVFETDLNQLALGRLRRTLADERSLMAASTSLRTAAATQPAPSANAVSASTSPGVANKNGVLPVNVIM